jgi:serine/threonine protein kinase
VRLICPHCQSPIELVSLPGTGEVICGSCGSTFRVESGSTAPWDSEAGRRRLGRFELIAAVGSGAFGTVYRARDPQLDRVVALKIPRAGNLPERAEFDRFVREGRSAGQLRHPSIVAVHEVGQVEGLPYIVSDFIEGVTLTDRMTAGQPTPREAATIVASVADALDEAHRQGVIHRDIKPSNIMLGLEGLPMVMDFGLAKREAGEITMTFQGQILGTPAFMSPEQAGGDAHRVDGRSDIYSLGAVLYLLLTGELPFKGNARMLLHQVLHDNPRSPRSLVRSTPRDLETICLKAMAKSALDRYPCASEFAHDLRRWLTERPVVARPVGPLRRLGLWSRRNPALAMAGGLALLAVMVMIVTSTLIFKGNARPAHSFPQPPHSEPRR